MTQRLLAPLEPDECALAALFKTNVDDSALRTIAAADYGWRSDECYGLLVDVRQRGLADVNDPHLRAV